MSFALSLRYPPVADTRRAPGYRPLADTPGAFLFGSHRTKRVVTKRTHQGQTARRRRLARLLYLAFPPDCCKDKVSIQEAQYLVVDFKAATRFAKFSYFSN